MDMSRPSRPGTRSWAATDTACSGPSKAAVSDVYVAYGMRHGGAVPSDWEHFEQMTAGFGAGETALDVSVRVDAAACRYVRFLSLADGWSDSVYVPGLKVKKGMSIVIR